MTSSVVRALRSPEVQARPIWPHTDEAGEKERCLWLPALVVVALRHIGAKCLIYHRTKFQKTARTRPPLLFFFANQIVSRGANSLVMRTVVRLTPVPDARVLYKIGLALSYSSVGETMRTAFIFRFSADKVSVKRMIH